MSTKLCPFGRTRPALSLTYSRWVKSKSLRYYSSLPSSALTENLKYVGEANVESRHSDIAFGFDIDGVLLRGSTPIPGASKTLKFLQQAKIPFILLTNGGGKTEKLRMAELSEKLDVPLLEENLVQSHTPFKELVHGTLSQEALEHKTILVTGGNGDRCRDVALNYGFKNVVTPADILTGEPNIWPYNQIFPDHYQTNHRPLPLPINPTDLSKSLKIDAMFIFSDPLDWALDIQIFLDLLLSHEGYLGTYSKKNGDKSLPNNGWQQDKQPTLYFSNPDLFWAAKYHLPRLGQGAFQAALQGVWNATTNNSVLDRTVIGKPHTLAFEFAELALLKHRRSLLGTQAQKLNQVWFVGDNELTDIKGANEFKSRFGIDWKSILVSTGIYKSGSVPKYQPTIFATDIEDAVKRVLDLRLCKDH